MATEPMSREAILRRNIADMEVDLRTQTERAEAAEAELAKLRKQEPIKYLYRVTDCFGHDVLRDDPKGATILETIPLFAAPVPAPAVPATCKISLQVDIREMLQWLIDQRGKHGHNHKQSGIWDDDNGAMAGKPCEACAMYDKARALLQSAEVTK